MGVNEKTADFELRVAGKMQRLLTSVVNKSLKNYLYKLAARHAKPVIFLLASLCSNKKLDLNVR